MLIHTFLITSISLFVGAIPSILGSLLAVSSEYSVKSTDTQFIYEMKTEALKEGYYFLSTGTPETYCSIEHNGKTVAKNFDLDLQRRTSFSLSTLFQFDPIIKNTLNIICTKNPFIFKPLIHPKVFTPKSGLIIQTLYVLTNKLIGLILAFVLFLSLLVSSFFSDRKIKALSLTAIAGFVFFYLLVISRSITFFSNEVTAINILTIVKVVGCFLMTQFLFFEKRLFFVFLGLHLILSPALLSSSSYPPSSPVSLNLILWARVSLILSSVALLVRSKASETTKVFKLVVAFSWISLLVLARISYAIDHNPFLSMPYSIFITIYLVISGLKNWNDSQKKIISLNQSKLIAAKVAHDIKSPLRALKVAKEAIKEKVDGQELELLDIAYKRIFSLSDLILKDWKNEGNEMKELNLDSIISEILTEKQIEYANRKNVSLSYLNKIQGTPIIRGNEDELKRAISNLINNSYEAIEQDRKSYGFIEIDLSKTINGYELRINDNGIGLSREQIQILGNEPVSTLKPSGHGLGSYQAKQAIQKMGGKISWISSGSGSGTTTTITLN